MRRLLRSARGYISVVPPNLTGKLVRLVPRDGEEAGGPARDLAAPPSAAEPGPRRAPSGMRIHATRAPALDDAEILEGVRRGDVTAAAALHDRARPQVDRTIQRLLGRRDRDHEDLAQLSLIEIVRSLRGFRGECSLDTWTSRVTAHTVFKELRRRRTERKVFDVTADVANFDVSPADPDRAASMRSALHRVRHHLSALDSAKAWTVLLHDVSGYDLREIAEITEVSVAAAQTRLVRGRRELHARIESDPELREIIEQMRGRS
jgi:RNA polymerase sigma-70 factor (ECF subfamily)